MLFCIIQAILLFSIFLTPLLEAKHPFGYEQVKVLFFMSAMIICIALLFVYHLRSRRDISFRLTSIDKKVLLFITILFIASLFGTNPLASIFGLPSYYQGAILYLFLFTFYMLVKLIRVSTKVYASTLLLSSFVVALDALSEWAQLHIFHMVIPTYNGRVVSTFGQPNLYSGFLLLTLPFSLYLLSASKNFLKIPISICIFLSIVAIVISESRASTILLFLLIGFYLFKLGKRLRVLYYPIIFFTFSALVLLVFTILPKYMTREVIDPLNKQWISKNSPEKRIIIWQVAVEQILNRPLLGYGLESFRYAYQDYFRKSPEIED